MTPDLVVLVEEKLTQEQWSPDQISGRLAAGAPARRGWSIADRADPRPYPVPMAFLANYDMEIAASLVAGADIWLNTPLRKTPLFASSARSCSNRTMNGRSSAAAT
jgi:hypothetical protein